MVGFVALLHVLGWGSLLWLVAPANFQLGKTEAMQEIAKAAKKPTEARAVIQTGMVIAGSDGDFSQAEQMVLREACAALGVSPAEFQL